VTLFDSHQPREEKLIASSLKTNHPTRNLKGLNLNIDNSKGCEFDESFLEHKQHFDKQSSWWINFLDPKHG